MRRPTQPLTIDRPHSGRRDDRGQTPRPHSVRRQKMVQHRGFLIGLALRLGLIVIGLGIWGSAGPVRAEHELLTPSEIARLGLEEAWRRRLSLPSNANSIVDHVLHVHGDFPKQYVEVVGKTQKQAADKATKAAGAAAANAKPKSESKGSETQPKPTLYARYLLEVRDQPEPTQQEIDRNARSVRAPKYSAPASAAPTRGSSAPTSLSMNRSRGTYASSGLLDRAEAERLARNDLRRLDHRGIEAEIVFKEIPIIRLYTLATDGTVECRDAETGELVWLRRVGKQAEGYSGLGVDDRYLTVANGGTLIRLDSTNGEVYGDAPLNYVAMMGPKHSGGFTIVPSIGNRIVAYPLEDLRLDRFEEIVSGAALSLPVEAIGSDKVCWGTAGGFVYVMEMAGKPHMLFRLNTDGIVSGAPAAAPGERFFFGSEAGQIYGIQATRSGIVLWNRPTGDPIYDSPFFFSELVLFRSAYGNVTCVDAETGINHWKNSVAGIAQLVGILDGKVYCRTMSGAMQVLDLQTGETLHRIPGLSPHILTPNLKSDRLYLVDARGTMQCLRLPGADMPTMRSTDEVVKEDEKLAKDDTKKPANQPAAAADPFGAAADPFGAPANDPFAPAAGGNDPFAPMDGADPFGANPF